MLCMQKGPAYVIMAYIENELGSIRIDPNPSMTRAVFSQAAYTLRV